MQLSSLLRMKPGEDSIFLIESEPKRKVTLLLAGIETCDQLVTLNATAPPNADDAPLRDGDTVDETMMDRENLLQCSILEHHLVEWHRSDLAPVSDRN